MKKSLQMIGVTGLMAGMLILGGCGDDNYGAVVTTTTTGATTTTTAATTTTTGASTTTTSTTTTTTLPAATIAVSAAGTSVATAADDTYAVAAGAYTYSIAGFSNGDVLDFYAGAALNVIPDTNQTDGIQSITASDSVTGAVTTITLTGLTAAQDSGLFNVPSFTTVFGAGTIQ